MGSLATKNTKSTEAWPRVRLGELLSIHARIGWQGLTRKEHRDHGDYLLVTGTDFKDGFVDFDRCVYVDECRYKQDEHIQLKEGDLLLTKDGTIGKAARVKDLPKPATLNGGVFVLRKLTNKLELEYLYHFFLSPQFTQLAEDNHTGSTVHHLNQATLSGLDLPLPPLFVQQEIVARLEKELASVDRMVKGFEEMKAEADQLFKAELKEAFEDIKCRGAETRRLGEICENLDCRRIPITKSDRKAGMYPYFGASGIVDYVDGYLYDGDYLLVSEDGANLIARSTPIAFSVSGKIWVNNHAHILSFQNISTQYYVEYYFEAISIAEFVTGAAQPKFTQKALNELIIPLPSLTTQREVVAKLDAVREKCAKLKSAADDGLTTAALLRKAILKEAFE